MFEPGAGMPLVTGGSHGVICSRRFCIHVRPSQRGGRFRQPSVKRVAGGDHPGSDRITFRDAVQIKILRDLISALTLTHVKTAIRRRSSVATIVAIALLAFGLEPVVHEVLGHCVMAWLLGIKVTFISSTVMEAERGNLLVPASGPIANLLFGWVAFWGRGDRSNSGRRSCSSGTLRLRISFSVPDIFFFRA